MEPQCDAFKGTIKEIFVDRREYTGPLWEQIEEAFQFVLWIFIWEQRLLAFVGRMFKLIINAVVHRSYLD